MKNEKTTLVHSAYSKIKSKITQNKITPGENILEHEIAKSLGMSRTPVREALLRLEVEGLIEIIPRHGIRVLPISQEDMREIYEIFISLEPIVAQNLAKKGDLKKKDLDELEKSTNDMEEALFKDDLAAWADADLKFHQKLVELHGNKRLINILNIFRDQTHRVRILTRHLRKHPMESVENHREIIKHIREGNPDKAYEAVKKHRGRTAEELLKILKMMQL